MDHAFISSLATDPEVRELQDDLRKVAGLEREDPERLDILGFATELCIAVSAAAGPDGAEGSSNMALLTLAAEGSRTAHAAIAEGGPDAPNRLADVLDAMIVASRKAA